MVFIAILVISGGASFVEAGRGWSATAEKLYQKAQKSYYSLKGSPEKRAYRNHWLRCIEKFTAVYEKFPGSQEAYKAAFTIAGLFHDLYKTARNRGDLDQALSYYQKVTGEFKIGRLTDDAYFHQGEIHYAKKDFDSALNVFEKVVDQYSDEDQAKNARKFIGELKGLAAVKTAEKEVLAEKPGKSEAALLKNIIYSSNFGVTRIIAHTSYPVRFSHNRLSNPDRVYVNLANSRMAPRLTNSFDIKDKLLNRVRVSQFDSGTCRLVLDLNPVKGLKVSPRREGPHVVIEVLEPGKRVRIENIPAKHQKKVQVAKKVEKPATKNLEKYTKKEDTPLIVIDPGHGGKDFGAKGKNGLLEKDVNLSLSKKVKAILEKKYKYRVIMTRTDDTFIPLDSRGDIANEKGADLFISIHANAAKNSTAHGIETYYLGIGNSEQAQETAARENGKLVQSVKDDQVQQILASLISTTKINDSARLAVQVQNKLYKSVKQKYRGVKNLGVKVGPFFVLHDTSMPSILIEVGFVTNSREGKRLKNSKYQDKLAEAIAKGIYGSLLEKGPTI